MNAFRRIVLFMTSLAHAWGIYPGYFGYNAYSAIPAPYFPNIVPQTQPLFAYSFITPHGPNVVAPISPAVAAKSIYTTPEDTFSGYSIQTEYEGGAKSQVVFVTGPQANQILQKSVDTFRQFVSSDVGQLTGRSPNDVNATNTTDTPASTPTALTPTASIYHFQLYPADTASFLGPSIPLQNLVSSFAYSITNDIASAIKDTAGEAQESTIRETGAAVTAAPPNASSEASENAVSTTAAITTTAAVSITTTAPPATTPESTTISPTPPEDNEVAESNITTTASDEIMETTSS